MQSLNILEEKIVGSVRDHRKRDDGSTEDEGMNEEEDVDSLWMVGKTETAVMICWAGNERSDESCPSLKEADELASMNLVRRGQSTHENPDSPIQWYPSQNSPVLRVLIAKLL